MGAVFGCRRFVPDSAERRKVLAVVFVGIALHAIPASTTATDDVTSAMARRPARRAEGASITVELDPMPQKYQILGGGTLALFTASTDSVFWCGANKPNPHSWLSPSVICLRTCDFQIVFCTESGAPVDTLDFVSVEPATYRVLVGEANRPEPGIYMFRYQYCGELIDEHMVDIRDPR